MFYTRHKLFARTSPFQDRKLINKGIRPADERHFLERSFGCFLGATVAEKITSQSELFISWECRCPKNPVARTQPESVSVLRELSGIQSFLSRK